MISESDLRAALRKYWGYSSFYPLQEKIVRSLLSGRDTCVIMPTGGGKSLCYQLPAALLPGETVVVVSPLIALMHDQVAQLTQMGISSAFLNSSLSYPEQVEVIRRARRGDYRLLYLSPERLARADAVEALRSVPVSFFAIDEAHCISEWGHEFRPDYRQLSRLRRDFDHCQIAAFTASATRNVRHDIIEQLQLSDPHKYIASFHRSNLSYLARETTSRTQPQGLLAALRRYEGSNVIVYAPTIKRVDETVAFLASHGIAAVPYHGQMENEARRQNQERWMSDEVPVLVGTVAFGMGINKAAVRAVIHLSMPKSIEQYYQEAGRAGRDGKPADCILLWQKRDTGLLAHFIEQIEDAEEKERSWQRYHAIRRFVESRECRHRQICQHFGEVPKWSACGACDVCGSEPEWLREAFDGSTLSTALKPAREEPARDRSSRSTATSESVPSAADAELVEYLREWRRETAKRKGVPAFVVLHDTSLEEIARLRPSSIDELLGVYGIGEKKASSYGREILTALLEFEPGSRPGGKRKTGRSESRSDE